MAVAVDVVLEEQVKSEGGAGKVVMWLWLWPLLGLLLWLWLYKLG